MTLVTYYSRTGHNRKAAQDIAGALGADIEEITDLRDRSGILGFIIAVIDTIRKKPAQIGEIKKNPAGYDTVIIGTPVWGRAEALAVRTYLLKYGNSIKKAAYFSVGGGDKNNRPVQAMEKLTGKKGIASVTFNDSDLKPANKGRYDSKLYGFIGQLKKSG